MVQDILLRINFAKNVVKLLALNVQLLMIVKPTLVLPQPRDNHKQSGTRTYLNAETVLMESTGILWVKCALLNVEQECMVNKTWSCVWIAKQIVLNVLLLMIV